MKVASLVPTGSPYHDIIEHCSIGRVAQLLKNIGSTESSGHAGQRSQLGSLVFF